MTSASEKIDRENNVNVRKRPSRNIRISENGRLQIAPVRNLFAATRVPLSLTAVPGRFRSFRTENVPKRNKLR